jgi:hypothetical protein
MTSIIVYLAQALMSWCLVDARSYQVSYPARRLQQETANVVGAKIRVADFASVLRSSGDVVLSETELAGRINVTSSAEPVLYGAYYLGPDQVAQINHTISTELVCLLHLLCAWELRSIFTADWSPRAYVRLPLICQPVSMNTG